MRARTRAIASANRRRKIVVNSQSPAGIGAMFALRQRRILGSVLVFLVAGCAGVQRTQEEGKVEIQNFARAIECEVAAVARDRRYVGRGLASWNVKSTLDLDVVNTVGADGKIVQVISTSTGTPTITPAVELSYKNATTAHVEFATIVPAAISKFPTQCDPGPDPSGTHLGLAIWLGSVLDALSPEMLGGLSYTASFDIIVRAGARFGYVLRLFSADAGPEVSRQSSHRLTVTLGPPSPPSPPLKVFVVNMPGGGPPPGVSSLRGSRQLVWPGRTPALDDPNLNRMIQQQAPVRIAPGSVVR